MVTDTRKAIALLAYLSVTGEQQSRDALAALLWPELDQTRARAALRRTLSSINAACDATWLHAERESVRLADDGSVECDVRAFHAALAERRNHGHPDAVVCDRCLPALEKAVALYRDDFMSGFSLRDSVNFDDWQFFQAESIRREFAEALERLVNASAERGQWQNAITSARRWLALDPMHEPAHRQLMLLYAWAGERSAALRQYQVCADVLQRELEVEPLPETTDLYVAIREQREPARPAPLRGPTPSDQAGPDRTFPDQAGAAEFQVTGAGQGGDALAPEGVAGAFAPHAYPFVGRAAERLRLREAHRMARTGGRLVVIEGEAGIGKTRLAETFLEDAQRGGALSVSGRCYEGEQELAYAPFVQMLRAAMALPHAAERLRRIEPHWLRGLRRLLPELGAQGQEAGAEGFAGDAGARARLFESIARVLYRLLEGPVAGVLLIDDIQWADQASVELFSYLVHRLAEYPVCVVATLRSGEAGEDGRIRLVLAEAQRNHNADDIDLSRLDPAAVEEIVRAARPDLSPELGARLQQESEGLPFFLVEYLAALPAGQPLAQGAWERPESVRELIRSRVARIGEASLQLLTAAAVIGRSFDFDTLRAVSGRTEVEAVNGTEELLARGLIREVDGGSFDFSHDQVRAVTYEGVSQTRRRLLHRRVAESLVAAARLNGREISTLAARIAYHQEQGAQFAEAAHSYYLAGQRAVEVFANSDAVAYLERALQLGATETEALHTLLGDAHTLLGDYGAAVAEYEVALRLAAAERRAAVLHRMGRVLHLMGAYDRASAAFTEAVDSLPSGEAFGMHAQILADAALTAQRTGDGERALELTQQTLAAAEQAGDRSALSRAHTLLSHWARLRGDYPQAREEAGVALSLAEAESDLALLTAALNAGALAHVAAGEPALALQPLQRALELCMRQGDRHREAALHNSLADVYHLMGDGERAMDHLKQAVAIFASIGGAPGEASPGAVNPEIWKLTEW